MPFHEDMMHIRKTIFSTKQCFPTLFLFTVNVRWRRVNAVKVLDVGYSYSHNCSCEVMELRTLIAFRAEDKRRRGGRRLTQREEFIPFIGRPTDILLLKPSKMSGSYLWNHYYSQFFCWNICHVWLNCFVDFSMVSTGRGGLPNLRLHSQLDEFDVFVDRRRQS